MEFKEKLIQYLFYYNHTVCGNIDIEEDVTNLCEYIHEYENMNFENWIKDNGLEAEYKEYRKFI